MSGGGSRGGAETRRELDEVTGAIVDCAVKLHQNLGPGLLESVYEAVLARDLARRGFAVERQKILRFTYDGMEFEEGLRLDLLVEDQVIVELKSVEKLAPVQIPNDRSAQATTSEMLRSFNFIEQHED